MQAKKPVVMEVWGISREYGKRRYTYFDINRETIGI